MNHTYPKILAALHERAPVQYMIVMDEIVGPQAVGDAVWARLNYSQREDILTFVGYILRGDHRTASLLMSHLIVERPYGRRNLHRAAMKLADLVEHVTGNIVTVFGGIHRDGRLTRYVYLDSTVGDRK